MNTKIIIQVGGGIVQAVCANTEVDIAIVDYDEADSGKPPFNGSIYQQDSLFKDGKAHELFTNAADPVEMEIKDELKRIKF